MSSQAYVRDFISTVNALLLASLAYLNFESNQVFAKANDQNPLAKAGEAIRLSKPKEALDILDNYNPAINERSHFFFLRGRALQDQKKNTKALEAYTISLFLYSSNTKALINRALVKGALRDLDAAMDDLNSALRINPRSKEALMNRGVTNAGLGKVNNAIYDFTEAIRLDPNYADAYRNRGITWNYQGKKEKACKDWRRALSLGQQDISTWVSSLCLKRTRED